MSGFSASSEPFTLQRDCPAVHVPYGDAVTLPAGQTEAAAMVPQTGGAA